MDRIFYEAEGTIPLFGRWKEDSTGVPVDILFTGYSADDLLNDETLGVVLVTVVADSTNLPVTAVVKGSSVTIDQQYAWAHSNDGYNAYYPISEGLAAGNYTATMWYSKKDNSGNVITRYPVYIPFSVRSKSHGAEA